MYSGSLPFGFSGVSVNKKPAQYCSFYFIWWWDKPLEKIWSVIFFYRSIGGGTAAWNIRRTFNLKPYTLMITVCVQDVMYMKWFIYELRIYMKVICDLRSEFPILSNWNKEAWKKIRASQGFEPVTLRDTGAMLYQLSYEATHWERGQLWVQIFPWKEWNDVMYMKWFIYELRIYMKVICDLRSEFPILSNWNKEAWTLAFFFCFLELGPGILDYVEKETNIVFCLRETNLLWQYCNSGIFILHSSVVKGSVYMPAVGDIFSWKLPIWKFAFVLHDLSSFLAFTLTKRFTLWRFLHSILQSSCKYFSFFFRILSFAQPLNADFFTLLCVPRAKFFVGRGRKKSLTPSRDGAF